MRRLIFVFLIGFELSCSHGLAASGVKGVEASTGAKNVAPRAGTATVIPSSLKEIEEKYSKAKTVTAKFEQETTSAALKTKKKSEGRIWVKRPGKFRWETLEPEPSISIGDGSRILHYTPPFDEGIPGQLLVSQASEVQSRLANVLLSGAFSLAGELKITARSPERYELTPRRKGAAGDVERAWVELDVQEKLIRKVTLEHFGGNRSEISLQDIRVGASVEDSLFRFDPPPGTEIIRN